MRVQLDEADKLLLQGIIDALGGGIEGGRATELTLAAVLAALSAPVTALAPIVPEGLGGANAVIHVPVALSGADNVNLAALDADEKWSVVGWLLTFTADTTLTFDGGAGPPLVLKVSKAGWSLPAGNFAWYTGDLATALNLASTAGAVDGFVYLRKAA